MKIKLKDLRPNPFRNLGEPYVIDMKKVESIAASIRTTGFWDNLLVRRAASIGFEEPECPGEDCKACSGEYCYTHFNQPCDCDGYERHVDKPPNASTLYEIAYGHHRLEALRLLVRKSLIDDEYMVEAPVRVLDDGAMVRIMAAENPISQQTIVTVRQYLATEIREPIESFTAEDIAQFVGSDWYDHRRQIKGILKKLSKGTS